MTPVCIKARPTNLKKFQEKGWLVQDDDDHYYIYAQTMGDKTQYGLVVGAFVQDYMTGVIKKTRIDTP